MPEEILKCSFCHKRQEEAAKLIATPKRFPPAYICDECVAVCNSILAEDAGIKDGKKKESWVHRLKSWWMYSATRAEVAGKKT